MYYYENLLKPLAVLSHRSTPSSLLIISLYGNYFMCLHAARAPLLLLLLLSMTCDV